MERLKSNDMIMGSFRSEGQTPRVDLLLKSPSAQFPNASIVDGSAHPISVDVRLWKGFLKRAEKVTLPLDRSSAARFVWLQRAILLQVPASLVLMALWVYCGMMFTGLLARSDALGVWIAVLGSATAIVSLPAAFIPPQYPRRTSDGHLVLKQVNRQVAFDCQQMNEEGLVHILG